jgi:hypothetical protein
MDPIIVTINGDARRFTFCFELTMSGETTEAHIHDPLRVRLSQHSAAERVSRTGCGAKIHLMPIARTA